MAEPYSFQADIWSVGCICSELVTGKRPYSGLVGVAAMFRMCEDATPPLPTSGISDMCRDFILQCWQKDWRKVFNKTFKRLFNCSAPICEGATKPCLFEVSQRCWAEMGSC